MKMQLIKPLYQNLTFLAGVIFFMSIHLQANYTATSNLGQWNSNTIDAISGNENITETNRKINASLLYASGTPQYKDFLGNKSFTIPETKQTTLSKLLSTGYKHSASSSAANVTHRAQTTRLTSKAKTTLRDRDNSKESNKSSIVICVIIIAVLVLICTALLISTVVLANQVSNLKKTIQSKRQARSNGDFLITTNSLWPLGLDSLQKRSQPSMEVGLTMEDLPAEDITTSQAKRTKDGAEKPNGTEERSKDNHKSLEDKISSSNQDRNSLTNFLVEI